MSRLAVYLLAFCTIFVSVLAAPTVSNETFAVQAIDKRVIHTGTGTWFYPGLGACGETNADNDPVVAISSQRYGTGSNCFQWISITANGKTAYGRTLDECQSCGSGDLDMSPSLFQNFAGTDVGTVSITWSFMPMGYTPY